MIMKRYSFSSYRVVICTLILVCNSLQIFSKERNKWIPDFATIQFAGSVGAVSVGAGWEYGKEQWQTELLLGIIPKQCEHPTMISFTIKQRYIPWKKDIWDKKFFFQPLHCGLFLNTVANQHFWTIGPERYPNGYYGFSTKLRFHVFLGQSLSYKFPEHFKVGKSVLLYYELSTCDLYIISAATNRYLSPKDYLSLALGIRWNF